MSSNHAASVQYHPILEDGSRIENDTRKQLAIRPDLASCHHGDSAMQMRSIADLAIVSNTCERFDKCPWADFGGGSNASHRVDTRAASDNVLRAKYLTDLNECGVWIGNNDLWDLNARQRLARYDSGGKGLVQLNKIFLVLDKRNVTPLGIRERGSSCNHLSGCFRKQLAVNAMS